MAKKTSFSMYDDAPYNKPKKKKSTSSSKKYSSSLDSTRRSHKATPTGSNLGAPVFGGRNKRNRAAVKAAGMD